MLQILIVLALSEVFSPKPFFMEKIIDIIKYLENPAESNFYLS